MLRFWFLWWTLFPSRAPNEQLGPCQFLTLVCVVFLINPVSMDNICFQKSEQKIGDCYSGSSPVASDLTAYLLSEHENPIPISENFCLGPVVPTVTVASGCHFSSCLWSSLYFRYLRISPSLELSNTSNLCWHISCKFPTFGEWRGSLNCISIVFTLELGQKLPDVFACTFRWLSSSSWWFSLSFQGECPADPALVSSPYCKWVWYLKTLFP